VRQTTSRSPRKLQETVDFYDVEGACGAIDEAAMRRTRAGHWQPFELFAIHIAYDLHSLKLPLSAF
jgi:hypothetical protein